MNRLRVFTIVVSFLILLSGCQSDQKQADKIHNILEEAAPFEKNFTTNLSDLSVAREQAQTVYMELIQLDIDDKKNISQKIDAAHTYTNEQQKLLKEARENYQKAYQQAITIEKPIEKLKDKGQKKQASRLFTIINEKKKLMDTFFEDYHDHLELQKAFYQQLEDENFNLETLNEQINGINDRLQNMGEIIQQFNQYTQQFIEAENDLLAQKEA